MKKIKILIVDDDPIICESMQKFLENETESGGIGTAIAYNGDDALKLFDSYQPDVILLDIMMTGKNGKEICSEIRKISNVPIIMVSAKSSVVDKVVALELGADDFIVKPFDMNELYARIKAILRRMPSEDAPQEEEVLRFDKLEISKQKYELRIDGKYYDIPPKELELLYYLASNFNHVFTRDQLLDKVWGFDYLGDSRTVDVHIKRLREKLDGVSDKWSIKTVWGVGYKFEAD